MENVEQSNGNENATDSTLGTFKSVEALKNSYDNLRSEFTKKSQILAEYQKENNFGDKEKSTINEVGKTPPKDKNSQNEEQDNTMHIDAKSESNSTKTIEKTLKNDENIETNEQKVHSTTQKPFWERETWDNEIREFFTQYNLTKDEKKELANILSQDKDIEFSNSPLQTGYLKMLQKNKADIDTLLNDNDFIKNRILKSQTVRDMVINDYLSQLNQNRVKLPQVIAMPSNAGLGSKGTKTPTTLKEANNLVRKFFE